MRNYALGRRARPQGHPPPSPTGSGPADARPSTGADAAGWDPNAEFPGFGSLAVSPGLPSRSVLFASAGQYASSLFWDNLVVTPVSATPAPGALVLGGIRLDLLARMRMHRLRTALLQDELGHQRPLTIAQSPHPDPRQRRPAALRTMLPRTHFTLCSRHSCHTCHLSLFHDAAIS